MNISICIPTCNRPDFLKQAVESCLNQTLLPYEILIGDDSPNNDSQSMVLELTKNRGVPIKIYHNIPSLRQAGNTNFLFNNVSGDKTVLLHDDDLLLPDSLQ